MAFEDFDAEELFREAQNIPGITLRGGAHFTDLGVDEAASRYGGSSYGYRIEKYGWRSLFRYRLRLRREVVALKTRRRKMFFYTNAIDARILATERRLRRGRLTPFDVVRLREDFAAGVTQAAIARKVGVTQATVYQVLLGSTYRDVGGPIHTPKCWQHIKQPESADAVVRTVDD